MLYVFAIILLLSVIYYLIGRKLKRWGRKEFFMMVENTKFNSGTTWYKNWQNF